MRSVIIFDLDNTLIDTTRLKKNLFRKTAQTFKISAEEVQLAYEAYRRNHIFQPNSFFALFKKRTSLPPKPETLIAHLFRRRGEYNYPDVISFLKNLRRGHTLVLATYGERKYQLVKLKKSGLRKFFSRVFVAKKAGKFESIKQIRKFYPKRKIVLVDNSSRVFRNAERFDMLTLKIKSGEKTKEYYQIMARRIKNLTTYAPSRN